MSAFNLSCSVQYTCYYLCYFNFIYAAKIYGVPTEEERNSIVQQVGHKWRQIGIHLGVDKAELDQIMHECSDDDILCCSELFRKWAAQEVSTPPFTWKEVIEVLDNDVVGESFFGKTT